MGIFCIWEGGFPLLCWLIAKGSDTPLQSGFVPANGCIFPLVCLKENAHFGVPLKQQEGSKRRSPLQGSLKDLHFVPI